MSLKVAKYVTFKDDTRIMILKSAYVIGSKIGF